VQAPSLDRPWRRPSALPYALARVRGIFRPPVIVTEGPADIVVDWDTEVTVRDETVLRVNVFRAAAHGPFPAILSIHPYGKDRLPTRHGKRWTYPFQYRLARQPETR
jgi:uncharacterized protein